jgi:transposase
MNRYIERRCMDSYRNSILYIGVDVHEKESQVDVLERNERLLLQETVSSCKVEEFVSLIDGEKHVVIESVGFVHPVYERLSSINNCKVYVANTNKLSLISKSSIKNDRNGAEILGDLLRMSYLPLAHSGDKETTEKLYLMHDRVASGIRRGEPRGTIRWLLKSRYIDVKDPFGEEGRNRLKELHTGEIDVRLRELEFVESSIEELDRQIVDERARLTDTILGIAPYTALFLACVLDDIDRFPHSKHACAYLGLVPWLDQSVDKEHLGHITKKVISGSEGILWNVQR